MPQDLGFSFDISASGEELLNGSGQLERITWLTKRIRQGDFFLLQDGSYSRLLLSELLECFVGGHFIATSILGFSLIERSIAGRLAFNGDAKKSEAKSVELLNAAKERGWLTESEFHVLDKLREMRNPLVHFHAQESPTTRDRTDSKIGGHPA